MSGRPDSLGRLTAAHAAIAVLWLLHWLPLPVLALLGRAVGRLAWRLARSRRHVARVNLQRCFPGWTEGERETLAREHFEWLGRSLLERGLLWFASYDRLRRLVRVEGDVTAAERSGQPVMWLLPHFVGLEFAGPALSLHQRRPAVDVYTRQSNPVFDAQVRRGRERFGPGKLVERHEGVRPVLRAIRDGCGFVNAPDMDFGPKESAFVPFFGQPACTLLAPARMARAQGMFVQTLVLEMLPGGRGYVARFGPAPEGFDDPDPEAGAAAFNRWLEAQVQRMPAQYFWVHRRFKTRPPGQAPVY